MNCLLPLLLAFAVVGCRTGYSPSSMVTLTATGDPGVSVRVVPSPGDMPEKVATVPATLQFNGRKFDLTCLHGPQSGRLSLSIRRDGFNLSTGDTTEPDQVTVFEVRPNSISAKSRPPKPNP